MAKSGYKKFKKQEKAKVKLKGKKTLLPKGQNVTDTNFKVKKIVVKEQLKKYNENELLTKKHLSIQDLISRLGHHNAGMRQEALSGLQELVMIHGSDAILESLSSLLQAVMALTVDRESDVRTGALKLLSTVFERINEGELAPLFSSVVCYLTCAMTHIEPAVRADSLRLLDTMLATLPQLTAAHTPRLLPHFLDLISQHGSGNGTERTLSLHLEGRVTSDKWRYRVIGRLNKLFSVVLEHLNKKQTKIVKNIKWTYDKPVYLGLYSPILTSGHRNAKNLFDHLPMKLQEYSKILMPLLLDTFTEAVPKVGPEESQTACEISPDSAALLHSIVQIILHIWNLLKLSSKDENMCEGFIKTWGESVITRLFRGRFPYAVTFATKRKRRQQNANQLLSALQVAKEDQSCVLLNLRLCLIVFIFNQPGENWSECFGYIKRSLRGGRSLPAEESVVLCDCLEVTSSSPDTTLLAVLVNCHMLSDPDNTRTVDFLTLIAMRFDHHLHHDKHFTTWLDSLPGLLCRPSLPLSTIQNIVNIARCKHPAFTNSLDGWIEEILGNLPTMKVKGDRNLEGKKLIVNLIYWINDFDDMIIGTLKQLVVSGALGQDLTDHLIHIIKFKADNIEDGHIKKKLEEITNNISI